jgi:hypothetical protein
MMLADFRLIAEFAGKRELLQVHLRFIWRRVMLMKAP